MKSKMAFRVMILLLHCHDGDAWVQSSALPQAATRHGHRGCTNLLHRHSHSQPTFFKRSSVLSMMNAGDMMQQISAVISTVAHVSPADFAVNPQVEAEILSDLSHVLFDVLPLLEAPSTLVFRLSILCGRFLTMESDYLPDHTIVVDELVFQVPLLVLSAVLFWRSLEPVIKASFFNTSEQDETAFAQLFQPVDVSWVQFRTMMATCIEWVDLEPGTVLEDESEIITADDIVYMYWLYEGQVIKSYQGNQLSNVVRSSGLSIDDPNATGLLADMKFLYSLDLKEKRKKHSEVEIVKYPMSTLTVGGRGAKVMRIQSEKLFELMDHDEHLSASMRKLLLKSLQRKVGLLLRSSSIAPEAPAKDIPPPQIPYEILPKPPAAMVSSDLRP